MKQLLILLTLVSCMAQPAITPLAVPQMKSECAVAKVNTEHGWISFYAPADKAQVIAQYGWLDPNQVTPERWTLYVDARYDLAEVEAYIDNCEKAP